MLEQEKRKDDDENGLKSLAHLKEELKDVYPQTRMVTVFHGQCSRMDCCTIHEYNIEVPADSPLQNGDYAHKKDIQNATSVAKHGSSRIEKRISEVKAPPKKSIIGKILGK